MKSLYQSFKFNGESTMKHIKVLGIDLAKNVFQLHGNDAEGKCILRKRLNRPQLIEFVANMQPCLIGLEACTGSHHWARRFEQMGHTVKTMAPQFVKPYVRSNKNDRNDARAIAEAVTRPDMKYVSIKTIDQQDVLLLHRVRALIMKQRTAQANQIRGLLAEYGVVIPKGIEHLENLAEILEDNKENLSVQSQVIFEELHERFKTYNNQIAVYDKKIAVLANQDARCQAIMEIEGVGPLTASAIVATLGEANTFKNGREVSAWLGLVPKQHSSGNTLRLSGISKRGDRYVRTLLIHGARSVVNMCKKKTDKRSLWIANKKHRCGYNKAAVAVANKNARIIWAMLASGECYRKQTSH